MNKDIEKAEALQSSTLRWVKASERLPYRGFHAYRYKDENAYGTWSYGEMYSENEGKDHQFSNDYDKWFDENSDFEGIEWLEESVDKEGRDLEASDNANPSVPCVTPLYCNNSIEKSLFMHDTINNEVVEFGTAKEVEQYIIDNFTEGNTAHPDYYGFDLFVKVGVVNADAKVLLKSNPTPFNSSKDKNLNQS